jgi:uncharacterized protein
MKMSGERVIPAPQARVWEALNDPDVLRQSVPGCQEMVKHSATEFSAKVQAKVGPVKANFAGDVTLSDLDPPHSYRISGRAPAVPPVLPRAARTCAWRIVDGQTRLTYDVDAKVGGKLAQIGSRLIDSTARRMADDFFKRFAEVVTSGGEPARRRAAGVEPRCAEPTPKAPLRRRLPAETKAPAAKKAPAKKPAANCQEDCGQEDRQAKPRRAGRHRKRPRAPGREFATGPKTAPAPSLMPEAAIAASAATRRGRAGSGSPAAAGARQQLVVAGRCRKSLRFAGHSRPGERCRPTRGRREIQKLGSVAVDGTGNWRALRVWSSSIQPGVALFLACTEPLCWGGATIGRA